MADVTKFSDEDLRRTRSCVNCGSTYSIEEYLQRSRQYFNRPYDCSDGCITHCLVCWLGCGPEHIELEGHLLRELGGWLGPETHLVVMPMARVIVESPLRVPNHTNIYPPGTADIGMLKILAYDKLSPSLTAFKSEASGVNEEVLNRHATVAFPYSFGWDDLWKTNHKNQMEFIRVLSENVDINFLNLICYRQCCIELTDTLPGRAGQLDSNHMMAGALLYNAAREEGRIIGGDAFSSIITKGLGLPIEPLEYNDFPGDGEVGHLVQHGLALYSAMLCTDNPTSKFTQALALLEFLAEPYEYLNFPDVKKIIARYVAKNSAEYTRLLERFIELTSKKDPITEEITGYRTRIMHLGDRLHRLVPDPDQRLELFTELDGYIRPAIDHMIAHSQLSYDEYLPIRNQMRPFEH